MARIERSALVSYSADKMFALVNDFESYPEFMPGCVGAELLESGDGWLKGRLYIEKSGIKQSFVTRNVSNPPLEMTMELVEGPFKELSGRWTFTALEENACKVELKMNIVFSNFLAGAVLGKALEKIASQQVDCLCQRAKEIYGC